MKKNIHIVVIFFLFCIPCWAQNKINYGVQVNGNLTGGIPSTNEFMAQYYKGIETFTFGYAVGLTIEYKPTKGFGLQSGLLFRKSGDKSVYIPPILKLAGEENTFRIYSIELPINVTLNYFKKISFLGGFSVAYNFTEQLNSEHTFTYPTMTISNSGFVDISNSPTAKKISVLGNIGVKYKIISNLYVQPYFQYEFIKTDYFPHVGLLDTPRNYMSLGLSVGYNLHE